jgi:hypothetical protein
VSKNQEMQKLIRYYKRETGVTEVDMREIATFAVKKGWPLPVPVDPIERLAKDFASAAREETREDKETGNPYRVNHAYTVERDGENYHLWVDIDEAPREPMQKSLVMRREQMVGDAVQLTFDMEHWNRVNPAEEPIVLPMDFTPDVEWRRNAPVSR